MLNKDEIIKVLEDNNISPADVKITNSAALVFHDIKPLTNKIELSTDISYFSSLVLRGYRPETLSNGDKVIKINEEINIFLNWNIVTENDKETPYIIQTVGSILDFKLNRNDDNDKRDILQIGMYLVGNRG